MNPPRGVGLYKRNSGLMLRYLVSTMFRKIISILSRCSAFFFNSCRADRSGPE